MGGTLYGFAYTAASLAYLKTLQGKLRKQIVAKIQTLATEPYPHNCRVVHNRMDGEDKVYRIRSGDYRILYVVHETTHKIFILDIDHRKDVYR